MSEIKVNIRPMEGRGDIEAYIRIMARALIASYAAFVPVADLELWIAQNLSLPSLVPKSFHTFKRRFLSDFDRSQKVALKATVSSLSLRPLLRYPKPSFLSFFQPLFGALELPEPNSLGNDLR